LYGLVALVIPGLSWAEQVNLALLPGAQAEQSSTAHGGTAYRAIDSYTEGHYWNGSVTHTASENGAWWQVTLRKPATVHFVRVWNRTDCCPERLDNAKVILMDSKGQTVHETALGRVGANGAKISLNEPKVISQVKIMLAGTNYLSLAEVEVFGEEPQEGRSRTTGRDADRKVVAAKDVQYEVFARTSYPTDGHEPANRCTENGFHIQIVGTDGVTGLQGMGKGYCAGLTKTFQGMHNTVGNVGPAIAIKLVKHGWDDWHHGFVTVIYKVRGADGQFHPQVISRFSRVGWMQAWKSDSDQKHTWVTSLIYWEDGFGSSRTESITRTVRESWKVIDARYCEKPVTEKFTETVRVNKEEWRQKNSELEHEHEVRLEFEGTTGVVGVGSKRFEAEAKSRLRIEERTEEGQRTETYKERTVDWNETAECGTIVLYHNTFNATGSREAISIGGVGGRELVVPIDVTDIKKSTRPIVFKKSKNTGLLHRWETISGHQSDSKESKLTLPMNEFERNKICELLGEQACLDL